MYADRITCCPLVSHGEYADRTDEQTDERQTAVTLRFPLYAIIQYSLVCRNLLQPFCFPWLYVRQKAYGKAARDVKSGLEKTRF